MSILALHGVTKHFGALKVTDDVSFEVAQGEALGIIGPNGAGKSTLFNLITGNLRPETGSIALLGRDVTAASAMERCLLGVGRSFQIPQPFESLTTFENLLVAASFGRDLPESEVYQSCGDILARTGLLSCANTPAGKLPLLQRKRLEMARALASAPQLLLLDEIAGGLTEAECASLIETIEEVRAAGVTIVWIEHVLHALTRVVSRLLVLDFGRVIAAGEPQEIMSRREVKQVYLGIDV